MSDLTSILQLRDVAVSETRGYDSVLKGATLDVGPGDMAIVRVAEHQSETPLADTAMGLCTLDQGAVCFEERPWEEMSTLELFAARSRIGRVFGGSAWLSNLDLDENVLLSLRHHRGTALADAEDSVATLASAFGVLDVLGKRPAWASRSQRKRAQWVRALAGSPDLLVLEHPERDVDDAHTAPLHKAVHQALQRGAAVLWITMGSDSALKDAFSVAQRFQILNDAWLTDTI